MLNNKGFAVSTVLYTLLIAFLMFLGAALAQFSSSSSLIGKANDDLVNGTKFEVMQVKPVDTGVCGKDYYWYGKNTIVKIKSRYGTMYWPKDFGLEIEDGTLSGEYKDNKNIKVECYNGDNADGCTNMNFKNPATQNLIPIPIDNSPDRAKANQREIDNLLIDKSFYDDIKPKIEKINNAENTLEISTLELYNESNRTICVHFNPEGDFNQNENYNNTVNCVGDAENLRYDDPEVKEYSDKFINYLENYVTTVNSNKPLYSINFDTSTNLLEYDLKLGTIFDLHQSYNPKIYIFDFKDAKIKYKDNITSGEFDTIVYYDLMPTVKNNALPTYTENLDHLALYNDGKMVSNYFFLFEEFDQAKMPENDFENYGKLKITDTISEKYEELTLYDICK